MKHVDEVARLYALPLDQFTGARNAAAKQATKDGDKELAGILRKLPKPSSAAWLVNVLVDRKRNEVEQVLELGASLKAAQASLDRAQLTALGQQRQRLLAAVARQSLDAAGEVGHDVGPAALPGVEQTLRAALADPGAAAAVLTGRLVRTLEASGWDPVDLDGAVAGPFDPIPASEEADDDPTDDGTSPESEGGGRSGRSDAAGGKRKVQQLAAARRKRAEADLEAARDASAAAEATGSGLRRRIERIGVRRDGLTASIEDLEERLAALRRELADVDDQAAELVEAAAGAGRSLAEAREAEEAAQSALADLDEWID